MVSQNRKSFYISTDNLQHRSPLISFMLIILSIFRFLRKQSGMDIEQICTRPQTGMYNKLDIEICSINWKFWWTSNDVIISYYILHVSHQIWRVLSLRFMQTKTKNINYSWSRHFKLNFTRTVFTKLSEDSLVIRSSGKICFTGPK